MTALQKYLGNYCDIPDGGFNTLPRQFNKALVVPAYREAADCLEKLLPALTSNQLLVLVINRPDNKAASNADVALLAHIERTWQCCWQHPEIATLRLFSCHGQFILLLDHARDGLALPSKQGVGLARKLGMDLCCRLLQHGQLLSAFVFNSDADTELPADYFTASDQLSSHDAAAILPYRHRASQHTVDAIVRYELRLRYYEQALHWAGSPYAFQTIGSTLCINLQHYAMVRGFPKRAAGEDFYLLNKLAKTGHIKRLEQPEIIVAARLSSRTPFGTGSALQSLNENPESSLYYHPDTFIKLRHLLAALDAFASGDDKAVNAEMLTLNKGLDAALSHARSHSSTHAQCRRHLQQWFDGFRTLKFIHRLRDSTLPSIDYEALQVARNDARYQGMIPTVTADEYQLTVHTAPS